MKLFFTSFCLFLVLIHAPGLASASALHVLTMDKNSQEPEIQGHFPYANPNAPKGGLIRLSASGSFDSFNPYIPRGIRAAGSSLITATLTTSSRNDPFVQYPYVAKSFEVAPDNGWIVFHLDPAARFHDGHPVTADDLVFTFNMLTTKGSPRYKQYYASVKRAEKIGPLSVKFVFSEKNNRELPVIVSQLPVLPEHWWKDRDFSEPSLEPPLGCGPYKVKHFRAGYSVEYERVRDWWGENLPVNKGRYNFDTLRYDYYRDRTVAGEAFRSGEFDYMVENTARNWAHNYTGPAFDQGLARKRELEHSRNAGMSGFHFNTRRPVFRDRRVRQALALVFDFEWINSTLFHGQYTRCNSFFSNSELAAPPLPDEDEQALLSPWKDTLPPEVFTTPFSPVKGDGSGRIRSRLRQALTLLQQSGWQLRNGVLRNASGTPFTFELLLRSGSLERVALPFQRNLKRLGIDMSVSTADTSRYIRRMRSHDYDMLYATIPQSDQPGNEQRNYWGSTSADTPGSRNWAGISDPVVDDLVNRIITAQDRASLLTATHALDRVLVWSHYVIPGWYSPVDRIAYWDRFGMPETRPKRGLDLFSWWIDPARDKRIRESGFLSGGKAE